MTIRPDQPVLVVEDSQEDFVATTRTLSKSGLTNPFIRCEDGDQALDFLYQRGSYSDPSTAPRPAMILLDLNLPGTDGREVLSQIKQDDDLRTIPVLVFTTSTHEADIRACYSSGANSYIQKPINLAAFNSVMQRLKDFWFDVAVLPPSG